MIQLVISPHFQHGQRGVLDRARPRDPAALREADRIADCAAANLKDLMGADDANEANLRDPAAGDGPPHEATGTWGNSPVPSRIREAFRSLKPLVDSTSRFPENEKWNEREMYGCLQALFLFIAHHVKRGLAGSDFRRQARLILPYELVDVIPEDADDDHRPDLGLETRWLGDAVSCIPGKTKYTAAFAIVEAKGELESSGRGGKPKGGPGSGGGGSEPERDPSDGGGVGGGCEPERGPSGSGRTLGKATKDAFVQLLDYTRHLYANQADRRYAWGLTTCRAEARACLIVNQGVVATHAMDLRSDGGFCEFVRLIVDWSICEPHQLGRDPTIRWVEELGCWEIDVPRMRNTSSDTGGGDADGGDAGRVGTGGDTVPYYFAESLVRADHLLGRHTRCFLATRVRPTPNVMDDPAFNPQTVIKDAWSYAELDDEGMGEAPVPREIVFHRMVRDKTPQDKRRHLPQFEDGWAMHIRTGTEFATDTTDEVLGPLCNVLQKCPNGRRRCYVHVRMATQLITHQLRDALSVYEAIIIVNDAVKAIGTLYGIDILHRDISLNNIMFRREGNGEPCGVLIDLDSALPVKEAVLTDNRVCTGTLPFLSVNNLERLPKYKPLTDKPVSAEAQPVAADNVESVKPPPALVDELESILYLLIWLGVWGATREHRDNTKNLQLAVATWGDPSTAAGNKRDKMCHRLTLGTITREFYEAGNYGSVTDNADPAKNTEWIQDSYDFLDGVVDDLWTALFDNERVACYARGTPLAKKRKTRCRGERCTCVKPSDRGNVPPVPLTPDIVKGEIDPFRERAKGGVQLVLLDAFAATIDEHAQEAKRILRRLRDGGATGT